MSFGFNRIRTFQRNYTSITLLVSGLIFSTSVSAETCKNTVFNRITASGTLLVGVKADYKPFGFKDENGSIIGFEIDLATDVANAMGVELKPIAVDASNRLQYLQDGKIDLLIATMADRADRRDIVGIPLPNYYTSGTNIMSLKALGFEEWTELSGKPVCGKQGAFYNKLVEETYGAEILTHPTNEESKAALRDGKCVAWVYDDSSIVSDLASGEWDDYEMPLKSEDLNPWALAVPLAEKDCLFGQMMSGLQYNWIRTGKIIELEQKWNIKPHDFLEEQRKLLSDWLVE